jgi:hypothetical protein
MENSSKHTYEKWYNTIGSYERTYKKWEGRADKILKRYRDDSRTQNNPNARFNILYSNVQTVIPAIFARLPRPDVSRRFRDNDPIGRVASMMLERALEFELEHYTDYKSAMDSAVFDRMIGGRGTAWVRYEPHIVAGEKGMPEDGVQVTEDIDEADESTEGLENESQERIEYECAPIDYVHWRDFGHSVARTWEEVTAVWRKVYMNRDALVERFGEELGYQIPLDSTPSDGKTYAHQQDAAQQAVIYEIWDKETGTALWISKSLGKILDERPDPLQLENFWPCPKPLYSNLTTENLEPIPDFVMYQDQAKELDTLADRIDGLINALKVRGVYDASSSELQRLFSEGENNTLIPVHNWMAFAEKQGMKGAIDLVDIAPFANALMSCYQAMEQVKGQIYEIMGIADIQRGQTDPNETLGAQIIKSNNAAGRLKTMQNHVVQFATMLLNIKAQIICNHFSDETILKISGADQLTDNDKALVPQALELLKSESAKNFRIEVTSDSMIYQDEQQEKQNRVEFLTAVSQFVQTALPVGQAVPELVPLFMEMLKFGVTAFKAGKQIEGLIDETADKFREQAKMQEGQPKQPSPEIQKLQMQAQLEQQKMQFQSQLEQQKMQANIEMERAKQEYQSQETQVRMQMEMQRDAAEREMEMKMAQMKMMTERNTQLLLAYVNNGAKVEVAQISAGVNGGEGLPQQYDLDEDMAKAMEHPLAPIANAIQQGNQQTADMIAQLAENINQSQNRPKQVIRGADGKIIGVQ